MRVLLISSMYHRLDRPVSAMHMHQQVLAIRQRGVAVQVLCPIPYRFRAPRPLGTGGVLPATYSLDGVEIHHAVYRSPPLSRLPRMGVSVLARVLVKASQRIRAEFPFDVIHAKRLYPTAVGALDAAQATGVPLVGGAAGSDVHTHPFRGKSWRSLAKDAIVGCDQVVSVSEGLARQILQLARPTRKIQTVYNGVDAQVFAPARDRQKERRHLGLPKDGVGICVVSRLVLEKGLAELVEAFGRVVERFPSTWLAVVGDGPFRRQLEVANKEGGVAGRIVLPGSQAHEDIPGWLRASDMFVLPSHNEGLPNVVLEAMATGLPVIATDVGGTSEALDHPRTGLLVPPRDPDRLSDSMIRLVEDRGLRESMGAAGRKRILELFTWERSAEALEQIYKDVTGDYE